VAHSGSLPATSETARALVGRLMPCLLLRGGRVMAPGDDGPVVARTPSGEPFDVLAVADQLTERYHRLYLVDLDGIERDQPQLDYLQEIARGAEVWIDAGVRTSDQAIDIVVAGAFRTVLTSGRLESEKELGRTWKLSPEIAFEIELVDGALRAAPPEWTGFAPARLAGVARGMGLQDVIVSPRGADVDWTLVAELAKGGSTWVDGTFDPSDVARLAAAGASGGIFHVNEELRGVPARSGESGRDARGGEALDDDT